MGKNLLLITGAFLISSACYADRCDEQTREYARLCISQYGPDECASHIADMESVCRSGELQGGRQLTDWEKQEIIRGLESLNGDSSFNR